MLKKITKEPLVYFFILGFVVFGLHTLLWFLRSIIDSLEFLLLCTASFLSISLRYSGNDNRSIGSTSERNQHDDEDVGSRRIDCIN